MKNIDKFIQEKFELNKNTKATLPNETYGKGNVIKFTCTLLNTMVQTGQSSKIVAPILFNQKELTKINEYIPEQEDVYFICDYNLPRNGKLVNLLKTTTCVETIGGAHNQCQVYLLQNKTILVHIYDKNNTVYNDTYIWDDVMLKASLKLK